MKRVLSAIQPTGDLHLGNYFGAVKNWVDLQDKYSCIYGVVNYHSMTMPYNAADLRETVKGLPIDRIHVETDAPFLAPQEKRGRENYPGFVKYVAQKIAEIKQVPLEVVARTTSKNAESFFKLFDCQ